MATERVPLVAAVADAEAAIEDVDATTLAIAYTVRLDGLNYRSAGQQWAPLCGKPWEYRDIDGSVIFDRE
ncbi:hypothetical protein Asppvi_009260 [Aspergillus pseudoviridinutans]|uniref:Uncharacterized protein n=1 Tax=Aspergillus pseudoviridinutans TaxID=1517512 RepID=A0A9P3BM91_9EURO|nr:uncharacterized protein Asppvi_009260 [Aspergillus pseudoviridinutans]GIJ90306.1 hypothetical protein Asppvi_009260 [Aspergillus pseudoviridinutans]